MTPDAQNMHDAYSPKEIAERVQAVGVSKARSDWFTVFMLSLLAGAFIGLGALFFTVVMTEPTEGFGMSRLVGGLAFSLGLILVVVGGAELFTGNNLLAMAWTSRLVSTKDVLRNWVLVYVGNAIGALGTVALVVIGNVESFAGGEVGKTALDIGHVKAAHTIPEAFALGILCNALVCLAVWLAMGGRSVSDKILAIVFPVTAFVAIGFEHSIANMYFFGYANALTNFADSGLLTGTFKNLAAVTAGNIVGGSVLVGAVYWLAYLRRDHPNMSGQKETAKSRSGP